MQDLISLGYFVLDLVVYRFSKPMPDVDKLVQCMTGRHEFKGVQDSIRFQSIVNKLMTLLRDGQLLKGQHDGVVNIFVTWVQHNVWDLAQPLCPEFRENEVEER